MPTSADASAVSNKAKERGNDQLGTLGAGNHFLEIDEVDGYDVTRKRVFYDDVVLVTRHRIVPWAPIVLCSLLTLLAGKGLPGIG